MQVISAMSVRRLFMSATTQNFLESYGCKRFKFHFKPEDGDDKTSLKLVPTYKTTALNHNPQNFTHSLVIRGHNYINRSYIDMYLKSIITHMGQNTTHTQISVSALHCPPRPPVQTSRKQQTTRHKIEHCPRFSSHTCTTLRCATHCAVRPPHT